ncbi:MAG: DUF4855 domain-containing protein, partial [Clostridia bacterium]|nr:DUF4855 domain-containing protein [Clostridia bacterium]
YVHEKGLKALWIPYYCAPGFEKARALGFDGPCLQAGYAFDHSQSENGDTLAGACEDSAAQAYKFGLGIEFELDLNVKDFYKRFFKYVHTAYSTGCMENGLMTMYQGVTDIYKCAYSAADSDQRQVYELLYQYVHGTFESLPPVIAKGQFVAAKIGERTSGTLTVTDADSKKNALKLRDKEIPEGLTAVFEGDGFYLVNTQDTVPGVYRVRLTVSDGYNDSEPEEILVFVYDPDSNGTEVTLKNDLPVYATLQRTDPESIPKGEQVTCLPVENDLYYVLRSGEPAGMAYAEDLGLEPVSSGSSDESVPNGNSSGINPLWIILPAAALVCAAAAVWLVIRKKKRNKGA